MIIRCLYEHAPPEAKPSGCQASGYQGATPTSSVAPLKPARHRLIHSRQQTSSPSRRIAACEPAGGAHSPSDLAPSTV